MAAQRRLTWSSLHLTCQSTAQCCILQNQEGQLWKQRWFKLNIPPSGKPSPTGFAFFTQQCPETRSVLNVAAECLCVKCVICGAVCFCPICWLLLLKSLGVPQYNGCFSAAVGYVAPTPNHDSSSCPMPITNTSVSQSKLLISVEGSNM